MIIFGTGIVLFSASFLVWFFGVRQYVVKNKGIDAVGANIIITAWNDYTVAKEIRNETKNRCSFIEIYAALQIGGAALVALAILLVAL